MEFLEKFLLFFFPSKFFSPKKFLTEKFFRGVRKLCFTCDVCDACDVCPSLSFVSDVNYCDDKCRLRWLDKDVSKTTRWSVWNSLAFVQKQCLAQVKFFEHWFISSTNFYSTLRNFLWQRPELVWQDCSLQWPLCHVLILGQKCLICSYMLRSTLYY